MRATASPSWVGTRRSERRVGDHIEKYELVRLVARGGMGSVWAAKRRGPHGFEKIVAIKAVLPELAADPGVRAMFLDEARLASAIDHRNVAHVIDFLEHEGALYIVMEWVDGIPLMALHDRAVGLGARIPVGIMLRILADVCAGLHAAHELAYANGEPCGVVHRDVSPHNVLVAIEGSAKLIDFGVAKTRFRVAPDSTFGQLRGRLDFMAPEQAHSEPLDRRADIWSVGASLYYLLAGHGPFGASRGNERLRRIIADLPPLPPPADVHPTVAGVLSGCLARRREDRFPTAEHLGWAIEEMGVAATARDVAAFLADRRPPGDRGLVITGRCAIPLDMTLLRPDTVSNLRPGGKRVLSKPSNVWRGLVALACVSAVGVASTMVSKALDASALVVAGTPAPPLVEDTPPVPAQLTEEVPLPPVLPPVEAPVVHATRTHSKPHPPPHQGRPKPRPSRDRPEGTR
jgi:serine/threonine protein kinase